MSSSVPVVSVSQRVGIFVDVQNLFYSTKILYQSKVDYGKLLEGLLNGRQLVRAVAYVVQKPDVDQASFHEALSRIGFEVRVKELRVRENEGRSTIKGSWGIGLAVDAMTIAPRLDVAILVTGDSDYAPLVESLHNTGVRVEIASYERSAATEFVKLADKHIIIQQAWIFKEKKFETKNTETISMSVPYKPEEALDEESGDETDEKQPASNASAPVRTK